MTTELNVTTITLDEIIKERDELKKMTSKWASKLAVKMFPEVEMPLGREKVYHIVTGSSRNADARNAFLKASMELKKELISEAVTLREQINNSSNNK